jgi:16S rRNA (guanine966-N2)-methyltransferase
MSSPRIIAGSARGLRLKSLPGKETRPITDRVKESLFNIIREEISDKVFLDLFGGIGSVGIEALSRGARFCYFIEKNPLAAKIIRENLAFTRLVEKSKVIIGDAFDFVRIQNEPIFDLIFIAPPQYKSMWIEALTVVDKRAYSLLSATSKVIVQIDPVEEQTLQMVNLTLNEKRKYGNTLLLFYRKN